MPDSDEVEPDAVTEQATPAADPVLLASVDVAREALLEITPADTVGELLGSLPHEKHVLSLHFATTMRGYPGWHWTVTLSRIDDASEPNVLELELLPGDDAVLAPEWIPWSVRLADYRAAQSDTDEDEFDEDEDDEELDEDDVDGDDDDLDDQVVVDDDEDESDEDEDDADDADDTDDSDDDADDSDDGDGPDLESDDDDDADDPDSAAAGTPRQAPSGRSRRRRSSRR